MNTPWFGLIALVAMFALPFLPGWLFDGPRTIKHYPRRHVCGDCGEPWADGHACAIEPAPPSPPLHAQLRRLPEPTALVRRSTRASEIDNF
jgi:hypothetical protein